jgi:hypothetical protein
MSRSNKLRNNRRPNALKHGVFSSAAFFPWENRAEFETLHNELIDEWKPQGAFEDEAVFTIATCMWKKRRIREKRQLEVLAHLQQPDPQSSKEPGPFFENKIEQLKFTLSNVSKSTAVAPPSARFNHDEALLLKLSSSFHGELTEQTLKWSLDLHRNKYTNHLKEAVQRENYPKFIDYVRALKKEIDEVLLPRVRAERPTDEYIAAKTASEFFDPGTHHGRFGSGGTPRCNNGQSDSAPRPGKGTQTGSRSEWASSRETRGASNRRLASPVPFHRARSYTPSAPDRPVCGSSRTGAPMSSRSMRCWRMPPASSRAARAMVPTFRICTATSGRCGST